MGWSASEAKTNNTIINFASQAGKTLGALYGGILMKNGRKRVFLVYNFLGILACILMQFLNIWTLSLGKLFHGFVVTVVHVASMKMVNETVPVYMLGSCGTLIQTSTAFGYLLVLGMGAGLP